MTDAYRIRSSETWDRIRDAFVGGETAESVCRRFAVGTSAFWERARAGGWRRADQADPAPQEAPVFGADAFDDGPDGPVWDPSDPDDAFEDPDALRRVATDKMALAIRRGQALEALRWSRVAHSIAVEQRAEAEAERARLREIDEATTRQAQREAAEDRREMDILLREAQALARLAKVSGSVAPDSPDSPDRNFFEAGAGAPSGSAPNRSDRRRALREARRERRGGVEAGLESGGGGGSP